MKCVYCISLNVQQTVTGNKSLFTDILKTDLSIIFTLSLIWAVDYLAGIIVSTHVHQNCPKTKNLGEVHIILDNERKEMRPHYREETTPDEIRMSNMMNKMYRT